MTVLTQRKSGNIPREEIVVIVIFCLVFIVFGFIGGWSTRAITNRNSGLVSKTEDHFAKDDWYQEQVAQLLNKGSKGVKR